MSACPDKTLLLHGFVDGELDAANSLAFETHLRTCAACANELARIEALRAQLAAHGLRHAAPEDLRARLAAAIEADAGAGAVPRPRGRLRFAAGALTGALAGAAAAAAAFLVAVPRPSAPSLQEQLVADHVRSLLASHLTDVQTSDQHLVKPWFNGRIDFAPSVPELSADGFPLAGGRLDYLDNRVVAAIVYRRRLHDINLFVRRVPAAAARRSGPSPGPGPGGASLSHAEGFNLVHWDAGGLDYWAVSDLNARELQQFQRLFVARSAG